MIPIIAPILVCAGIGYGWARLGVSYPSDFVTRLIMNIGAPCLILSAFSGSDIDIARMGEMAVGSLGVMAAMAIVGLALIRALGLPRVTYLSPLLFPNIGNMGLPLCLFAFGETGLALGLTVFLVVFALHMSLGLLLVGGESNPLRLLRQPVLWATAAALLLVLLDAALPPWLDNTTRLLGGVTIPLMLLTLGVSLAQLKISEWRHSMLFSAVRVMGGFALGLGIAELLGLEGAARGVLILQASMPVAVFNYLFALHYGRSAGEVAGMVVLSTLLAFLLLPFIVSFVLL